MTSRVLLGVFVGGGATRMGGVPKGLLPVPGHEIHGRKTIVEALAEHFFQATGKTEDRAQVVLVGQNAAYAHLPYATLTDEPAGIGPLGGLRALLLLGKREESRVVAVGCDMPGVTRELFQALLTQRPAAPCVAARRGDQWEPLFSRFEPEPALAASDRMLNDGSHALHRLLRELDCQPLELSLEAQAALDDRDEPDDVPSDCRSPLLSR